MNSTINPSWQDYMIGKERNGLSFTEKPWGLENEQFIGIPFKNLIPIMLQQSSFHETWFEGDPRLKNIHGGIIQANFTHFTPKPHEDSNQTIKNNIEYININIGVDVSPSGLITGYNPLEDTTLEEEGIAVGFGSRVMLNNLDIPGSSDGWAHFPMLDIIKPPTPENIKLITQKIIEKTGLNKFFILGSSDHGMMMIGPELIDEEHLIDFWNKAELINHYEIDKDDVWVDSRWISHSKSNFQNMLGINLQQVCGILRATSALPLKPFTPVVAAAT